MSQEIKDASTLERTIHGDPMYRKPHEANSLAPLRYVILLLFSLNYSGEIPHGRTADGELRNWTMKNLTVI